MKIYVASSWRNVHQPMVVEALRARGHEVYDFRNPPGATGFRWSQALGADRPPVSVERYREALEHPIAEAGFISDRDGMAWADACVVVMPCGRSAHLEGGWFCGRGRPCVWWYADGDLVDELELMVKLGDGVVQGLDGLDRALDRMAVLLWAQKR